MSAEVESCSLDVTDNAIELIFDDEIGVIISYDQTIEFALWMIQEAVNQKGEHATKFEKAISSIIDLEDERVELLKNGE